MIRFTTATCNGIDCTSHVARRKSHEKQRMKVTTAHNFKYITTTINFVVVNQDSYPFVSFVNVVKSSVFVLFHFFVFFCFVLLDLEIEMFMQNKVKCS